MQDKQEGFKRRYTLAETLFETFCMFLLNFAFLTLATLSAMHKAKKKKR